MNINEALKSLDSSWKRDEILLKIKNGINSEKIINEFFYTNQQEIGILSDFMKRHDQLLLNEIEQLSNIETKIINKIKNYSLDEIHSKEEEEKYQEGISKHEKNKSFNLILFMTNWSNKFVIISLIVISAIALSKQAFV